MGTPSEIAGRCPAAYPLLRVGLCRGGPEFQVKDYLEPAVLSDQGGIQRLNHLFIDYINFGGFPELSLSRDVRRRADIYVREDILLLDVANRQWINKLIATTTSETGRKQTGGLDILHILAALFALGTHQLLLNKQQFQPNAHAVISREAS